MRILINIGNTRTSAVLSREGAFVSEVELLSTEQVTRGAVPAVWRQNPSVTGLSACVVPEAGGALRAAAPAALSFVRAAAVSFPDLRGVDTRTLGQDRIANAVGALHVCPPPVIVLDCGTALTVEAIDADGVFRGGSIAPGRGMLLDSLHRKTAQLPRLALSSGGVAKAVGSTTAEAIRGGTDRGAVGMARELLVQTRIEIGEPDCPVLVTGGDAGWFFNALDLCGVRRAPENLTLVGLARLDANGAC